MKLKRILSAALAFACVITVFSGCDKGSKDDKTVNVAFFPNITHAQAMIMQSQKSFENALGEDYSVKWTSFNAGPAEVEALKSEDIDIGYIGPVPAISANVSTNGDVNIIAGATNGGQVLIAREDANIKEVKDLANKTVAIPQAGNTQHLALLKLLSDNGLKAQDKGGNVNVTAVKNSEVESLFDQGEIDAALVPEPWGTVLENSQNIKATVVLNYDEIWRQGDYPVAVVVVRKEFQEEHPEIVEKFLKAHKDATLYIQQNISESAKIVNEKIEELAGSKNDDKQFESAFSRIVFTTDVSKEAVDEYAKINLDEGFISKLPDDKIIDDSIMKSIS